MRMQLTPQMAIRAALVLLVVGCSKQGGQSPGRFPHQSHLTSGELNCLSCHKGIPESSTAAGLIEPGYAMCRDCHKSNVGPGQRHSYNVAKTYVGAKDRKHISFSHKQHYETTEGQCVKCHRDVQDDVPTPGILPPMAACLVGCHQEDYDRLHCTGCHQASDLVKLRPLTDVPHGVDYVPRHQTDAARAPRLCETCHTEDHCTGCHNTSTGLRAELQHMDKIDWSFQHRGDVITRHAIEARTNPTACVRCHEPTTCDACHVRNRVSGNALNAATPHPPGWVGGNANAPTFHGRAARRRVHECAGCHEQGPATNCIRCHKVGAFGGSPHPSGWKSSQSTQSTEMCQYCHRP